MAPSSALVVRSHNGKPYYEAKFRDGVQQVMRRIGPAWLQQGPDGQWVPRRGRVPDGYFDERRAHVRAAEVVATYLAEGATRRRAAQQPATFRELAASYMHWLATDYGAKPTTLRDHAYKLAEPGTAHGRGAGVSEGRIMRALGDMPAESITPDSVRHLLSSLTADGLSARNVNKYRNLIAAIFNHGVRRETGRFKLAANPTVGIELRREPKPAPLIYFSPEEIEAVARALAAGVHRVREATDSSGEVDRERRAWQDPQDAEAVRLSAYTGLRRGEARRAALEGRRLGWRQAHCVPRTQRRRRGCTEERPLP